MFRAIRGITVQLMIPRQTSVDGFNRPAYRYEAVDVEDVLVTPLSSEQIVDEIQLSGKRAVYELCIPKSDQHDWTDVQVTFFGKTWRTIGPPLQWIEENLPLRWNKKVKVEAYE